MKENTAKNIPEISIQTAIDELSGLYSAAIRSGISFSDIPTAFLWGPPGVGKSQGVRQIADNVGRACGKKTEVIDVRLLLFSPIDLRGVPVADEHREFTNWLKPRIFDMPDPDTLYFLFLDELSAAPQSVQAAAYQICLDRKVGEHRLPENCFVIAAGNRTTDGSVAYKMPKALANRLLHLDIVPDYAAWRSWAVSREIDGRIIGFLGFDRSRLCVEPGTSDLAYPTPRSWAFVSNLLSATGKEPGAIHDLIASVIGCDCAIEFEKWSEIYALLPNAGDILNGVCRTCPTRQDILYALVSSLVAAVSMKKNDITLQQLENVCAYASRFPSDFAAALFSDLNAIEPIRLKLMKCRSFPGQRRM